MEILKLQIPKTVPQYTVNVSYSCNFNVKVSSLKLALAISLALSVQQDNRLADCADKTKTLEQDQIITCVVTDVLVRNGSGSIQADQISQFSDPHCAVGSTAFCFMNTSGKRRDNTVQFVCLFVFSTLTAVCGGCFCSTNGLEFNLNDLCLQPRPV